MKINVEREIKVPDVPNFIIFSNDVDKISIADLSQKELLEIGECWKNALIDRAHQIRKERSALKGGKK